MKGTFLYVINLKAIPDYSVFAAVLKYIYKNQLKVVTGKKNPISVISE